MAEILPYLGVAKTDPPQDGTVTALEDYTGMTAKDAETLLKEMGLEPVLSGSGETVADQLPSPGQSAAPGSQVILYLNETPEGVEVPDFTGMNRQQAGEAAGKTGLRVSITGNSETALQVVVTSQTPAAGEQVPWGTEVILQFTDTQARD